MSADPRRSAGRRPPTGPSWVRIFIVGVGLIEEGVKLAALQLTATPVQWLLIEFGRAPAWSQAQVHLFTALSWGLLALDALVGLVILRRHWRQARNALEIPRGPEERR